MNLATMYEGVGEANREAVREAAARTPDGYIGPLLCKASSGTDRCGYLAEHRGLHRGMHSTWCDREHPCMAQRERIDFDKHPNHWVCPRCSGGAA